MKTSIIYKDSSSKRIKKINTLNLDRFKENTTKFVLDNEEVVKKEIFFNGARIIIVDFNVNKTINLDVKHDFPFMKVQFEIEGYSKYTPYSNGSLPLLINSGEYNFFYFPDVDGKLEYNKSRKTVQIQFTESFIENVFRDFFKISEDLGKALKNKESFILFAKSKPISYKMQLLLNDIIDCSFEEEIKEVYLFSKVKEILSLLLVDIKHKSNVRITEIDIKRMEQAEKILIENLQNPPTIIELSKQVGVNQQKLKVLFKKHFKSSIFKYLSNHRMVLAKKLLENPNLTINEVSLKVGYKNPQHFTVAFKKKFTILPKDFRQNNF